MTTYKITEKFVLRGKGEVRFLKDFLRYMGNSSKCCKIVQLVEIVHAKSTPPISTPVVGLARSNDRAPFRNDVILYLE